MTTRAAIVTGGIRGLGKAMALGLLEQGYQVLGVGHLPEDVEPMLAEVARIKASSRFRALVADIRKPAECDRIVKACLDAFGSADILVNNGGLTFTYIWPDKYRRKEPPRFYEASDEVIQNVMDTNYVGADQLARRVAPLCVARGWGRIVNVTTKLTTMNQHGSIPYGSSKAALEMASEVWAKDVEGTGLTVNIVNPGAGANTPGMAQELRDLSAAGKVRKLVEPEDMVPPLLWVCSTAADKVNGMRYDANAWDTSIPPAEAAAKYGRPAGFLLKETKEWDL